MSATFTGSDSTEPEWHLDQLPPEWLPALLPIGRDKRPLDPATGRRDGWPLWPAFSPEALAAAPAVGLRLGELSDGTMTLDFDGPGAEPTFQRVFGRPSSDLPLSICWTSGKPHRRQIAFKVPRNRWADLDRRQAKDGALEFRWTRQQSVILGAHPETDGYRWVEGGGPGEVELAEAPAWLLDGIPSKPSLQPPLVKALNAPAPTNGDPVPFREFLSRPAKELIDTGSRAGSCNDEGLSLSLELVAVEAWLIQQGVKPDETARDAYACYLSHCDQTINGAPFNTVTAWKRFDGAVAKNPKPATPEEKLLERFEFHTRKGGSSPSKVVSISSKRAKHQATHPGRRGELPYLSSVSEGVPDGWIYREDLRPSRTTIQAGDLSALLRRYFPGRLTYNLLTMAAEANGHEIKEADVDDAGVLLSEKGYKVTEQANRSALLRVAREHSYDPVRQYLEAVGADPQLEPADLATVAVTYLGATDPLYSAMLRACLIGAVARIFDPGCQMDGCLVLQSPGQGVFKSTFLKTLASPEWFNSSTPENEKDFLLNVHRCWIFELAELESYTGKRDAGRIKNTITTTTDLMRVPYGRLTEPRPRRSIFTATCNRDDFLKDETGSRRFWVIPITRKIDCNRVRRDRDAI